MHIYRLRKSNDEHVGSLYVWGNRSTGATLVVSTVINVDLTRPQTAQLLRNARLTYSKIVDSRRDK